MPKTIILFAFFLWMLSVGNAANPNSNSGVKMAYFQVDVTPEMESALAFGTANIIRDSLTARGIILVYDDKPIVLLAVDWIGIANEGIDVFRNELAKAVETTKERINVHALHFHDAVRCDFLAPRILDQYSSSDLYYDTTFLHNAIGQIAIAAKAAMKDLRIVTQIGFGQAKVARVASNRRLLDHHGKVENMRWSNTKDIRLIRESEGVIDPWLKMVTFYEEDRPLVSMSYYAVHPVTTFGDGEVSTDFVGIARKYQEQKRGHPQIYFTGAAGNTGVGKYNIGSQRMRYVLASRLSMAMDEAFENSSLHTIRRTDVKWKTTRVYLPLADYMNRDSLELILSGEKSDPELPYLRAVSSLAWWKRVHKDPYVQLSALKLGDIQLLSLPGEPFVEYQLAAQQYFPDQHICTAAYEEYGMGYIGTKEGYSQGGYETSKMASSVGADAEEALMKGIMEVLK